VGETGPLEPPAGCAIRARLPRRVSTERIPPLWILSLPWLTFGMVAGFAIVSLPQMLAAQGVPGGSIARAVAIILSPICWNFLLAPFLDVRWRRRTYALLFGPLAAATTAFTVIRHGSLGEVEAVMMVGLLSACMYQSALGGWIGGLIGKGEDSRVGAWSTVFIIGGNGVGILIAGVAIGRLTAAAAAACVLVTFLAPLLVFPLIPAPPPGERAAIENFNRFAGEIALLLKRREVLVTLALFALPAASFALTNALGGWSASFHAPASWVSLISGVGLILGSVIGCAIVPPMAAKWPLRPLYLAIGLIGAAFTVSLLLLPRAPTSFALAFMGENLFQAAAIATSLAITFELIGPGNPLAATTFALLTAATNLPIDYMEFLDAQGYDWHGIAGAFLADALVSASACVLLAFLLHRTRLPAPAAAALS
jgi:MFS transporter, PAT family, beta-lactamase induction signal transducer AmpG